MATPEETMQAEMESLRSQIASYKAMLSDANYSLDEHGEMIALWEGYAKGLECRLRIQEIEAQKPKERSLIDPMMVAAGIGLLGYFVGKRPTAKATPNAEPPTVPNVPEAPSVPPSNAAPSP